MGHTEGHEYSVQQDVPHIAAAISPPPGQSNATGYVLKRTVTGDIVFLYARNPACCSAVRAFLPTTSGVWFFMINDCP